jgi:serine/threonine-protein kinase HipA
MTDAKVILWNREVGAVSWLEDRQIGVFQYHPDFIESGIQLSPLMMPLNGVPYEFPFLPREAFKGLPGLIADSLPDAFGNAVINAWLAVQGRSPESFNPVERLCYIGTRGMGALEFEPALKISPSGSNKLEVAKLVELSNIILNKRQGLSGYLNGRDDREALGDILRVSTSAGGARAKAILAWSPITNEFRSGQVNLPPEFEYWILKFDGVSNNRDKELADPQGYGKIEFVYSLMAAKAGIEMAECRLHHEGGRSHFMTRRFDRDMEAEKIHMQSLSALSHIDYNQSGLFSYEQTILAMDRLGISEKEKEQQVLRAIFNVIGRNQDDHVKNIAFLMDKSGKWHLSPAFDLSYAYDPYGLWTNQHQMSINGKRDNFEKEDLIHFAEIAGIKKSRAEEMIEKVVNAIKCWPDLAEEHAIESERIVKIQSTHRLFLIEK